MNTIRVLVQGRAPRPQGSMVSPHKGVVRHAKDEALYAWRSRVRQEARLITRGAPPFDGPMVLGVVFFLDRRRGKRLLPWAQDDGDVDKLLRAIGDALSGVVWKDDSRIIGGYQAKLYADQMGMQPGALIEARPWRSRIPQLDNISDLLDEPKGDLS